MSKALDYIADLERENRTIKSILYCTKRSCNNCGKVNCENFQRQRIDCCGLWISYKEYIKQQEEQIADIKANCDLAIEGRDITIKELEKGCEETQELLDKQIEATYKLDKKNAELAERLEDLQEQNSEMFDTIALKSQQIEKLEKENAELKDDNKVMADNYSKMEQKFYNNLTKAIKIIKGLLSCCRNYPQENAEKIEQAQQFLEEIKK